jgi:hypothetical protein
LGSSPAASTPSATSTPPAKKQKTSHSLEDNIPDSPLSRLKSASDLALQRDSSCCVLTRDFFTEVSHIYPFHAIKRKEEDIFGIRHTFWNHLKNFWPETKVAAWEAELFPEGLHEVGVERVYNLITLSRTAHVAWGQGAFALKPISVSDDNMTLTVQFFWQKKQKDIQTAMSLSTKPFSTEGLDGLVHDSSTGSRSVLYNATDEKIKSGDYFDLHTTDPTTKPLPSFQLLEMQWFLQRILGMAGGVGDVDLEDLMDDPENPDYCRAGVVWDEDKYEEIFDYDIAGAASDEDEDEKIPDYDVASAAKDKDKGEDRDDKDEDIPGLDFDDEVQDSSLVSDTLLSSPEFLRKGKNVHLPDLDHSKHHTEEAVGDGDGDGDGDGAQVVM